MVRKSKDSIKSLSEILFLDIETCAEVPSYEDLNLQKQSFWDQKCIHLKQPKDIDFGTSESFFYKKRAGIYAEYSKIICISVGFIDVISQYKSIIFTKSYFNNDEESLLNAFANFLNENETNPAFAYLCGHNIKEFDIPFICRRMLVNQIKIPRLISISGFKPWQTPQLIDTMELWKFGDYKNYISLDLMCSIFNIESPKCKMSGDKIHDAYWVDNDMNSIIAYCENDVYTVAQVFVRLKQVYPKMVFCHTSRTEAYNQ